MHKMRCRPVRWSILAGLVGLGLAFSCMLCAQEPFPEGIEGELYYCPRIDLNPPKDGGPLSITLDGILDEAAWTRASYQGQDHILETPLDFSPIEEDFSMKWAVVADANWLYIAWRVVDEAIQNTETDFCNVWQDDAIEVYIDALNDGPDCLAGTANCYLPDDAQITVGADNIGNDDPDLLEFGGVAGKGSCDFGGSPWPTLCKGIVKELESEEGLLGWQAEIALALDTLGNNDDGTPEWHIVPDHGLTIGFSIQGNDDDNGAGRDHKIIWAKKEVTESAWRNPGAFGKLTFVAPDKPLVSAERDVPDGLINGGSATVSIKVKPIFGKGIVSINEKLPADMTPSAPSGNGVVNGDTVSWDLGLLESEATVTYTLTVGANAIDGPFPGTGVVDGQAFPMSGDTTYTGSPFNSQGFIKLWNHLGPLGGGACAPGPDLALDWIVNEGETITEGNIAPFPGMIVRPKYNGNGQVPGSTGARSTGLVVPPAPGVVAAEQFPVWKPATSASDTVDHKSPGVLGFNADNHVTLSCIYVTNLTGASIDTNLGIGHDDSMQVFLNGASVGQLDVCQPWGAANEEQATLPITLLDGENQILVKVADGDGDSGFRLRIQDPAGGGLLPPKISVSVESKESPPPARVARTIPRPNVAIGEEVDVSLSAVAPAPASITIREALALGDTASSISHNGKVEGGFVVWNLAAATQTTVSYKLLPAACAGDHTLPRSTFLVGPIEAVVTGDDRIQQSIRDEPLGIWDSRDLGPSGGAAEIRGPHAVAASGVGEGIKLTRDEFRFISRPLVGDFEFTARIDCLGDPSGSGLAGIMVRDTFDQYSANVFMGLSSTIVAAAGGIGSLKASLRRDTNTNRSTSAVTLSQRDVQRLPIYVRIVREGLKLTLKRSDDGTTYTDIATRDIGTGQTQVALKDNVLVGLAVTGGGAVARGAFGDVSGPEFVKEPPGKKFRRGEANGDGAVDLTDPISVLNFQFQGGAEPICKDAADADDSGILDLTDAIYSLNYQFLAGPRPPEPGPADCGVDPTPDEGGGDLGCAQGCP